MTCQFCKGSCAFAPDVGRRVSCMEASPSMMPKFTSPTKSLHVAMQGMLASATTDDK
jgi:hypothetical protein